MKGGRIGRVSTEYMCHIVVRVIKMGNKSSRDWHAGGECVYTAFRAVFMGIVFSRARIEQ